MAARVIASVVGARPQFIKAAPVSRALQGEFDEVLIHTGQHYDTGMSDVFFADLGLRAPDHHLGVGSASHGEQTARMLLELERVLASVKPDLVLVYGDTNSTLSGALAAAKLQIPVAHVEAGLRSYNRSMPEEINRVVADHLSQLLFCPTSNAVECLKREGIAQGVHLVGDVMMDALQHNLAAARERSTLLEKLGLQPRGYALATVHRAANTDDPKRLKAILDALGSLPARVVTPLHPRTRRAIQEAALAVPANVMAIEPAGYLDMLRLEESADCILTDSGGMQKEAFLLGVRCITLREETEWVETLEAGWNTLVGVDPSAIQTAYTAWRPEGERPALYGDGRAAVRIASILKEHLS